MVFSRKWRFGKAKSVINHEPKSVSCRETTESSMRLFAETVKQNACRMSKSRKLDVCESLTSLNITKSRSFDDIIAAESAAVCVNLPEQSPRSRPWFNLDKNVTTRRYHTEDDDDSSSLSIDCNSVDNEFSTLSFRTEVSWSCKTDTTTDVSTFDLAESSSIDDATPSPETLYARMQALHRQYNSVRRALAKTGRSSVAVIREAVDSQVTFGTIVFVPFTKLSCWSAPKTSMQAATDGELVHLRDVPPDAYIIFISHRWWRPDSPDTPDAAKLQLLQRAIPDVLTQEDVDARTAFIWWDMCCVAQDDLSGRGAVQIRSLPLILMCANACFALTLADEETQSHACARSLDDGGSTDVAVIYNDLDSRGSYENRVWTQMELFTFTSRLLSWAWHKTPTKRLLLEFHFKCEPKPHIQDDTQRARPIHEAADAQCDATTLTIACSHSPSSPPTAFSAAAAAAASAALTAAAAAAAASTVSTGTSDTGCACASSCCMTCTVLPPVERLDAYRRRFHTSSHWTLPPATNLGNAADLDTLEPLMLALDSVGQHADSHLHSAIRFDFPRLCTVLAGDVDVNTRCAGGLTPLMLAVILNRVEIVKILLDAGADPNARFGTSVPVPFIISGFHTAHVLLRLLRDAGCDLAAVHSELGNTLLHHFASSPSQWAPHRMDVAPIIDELISAGIDPLSKDKMGRTAIAIATRRGFTSFVAHLNMRINLSSAPETLPNPPVASVGDPPAPDRAKQDSPPQPALSPTPPPSLTALLTNAPTVAHAALYAIAVESRRFVTSSGRGYDVLVYRHPRKLSMAKTPAGKLGHADDADCDEPRAANQRVERVLVSQQAILGKESNDRLAHCLLREHPKLEVWSIDHLELEESVGSVIEVSSIIDAMADDLQELVAAEMGPCHLLGMCVSCASMMQLAAKHPKLVKSLMLSSPTLTPPIPEFVTIVEGIIGRIRTEGWPFFSSWLLQSGFLGEHFFGAGGEYEGLRAWFASHLYDIFHRTTKPGSALAFLLEVWCKQQYNIDYSQILQKTLVVIGAEDHMFTKEMIRANALLVNNTAVVLQNCAHIPQLEAVEPFAKILGSFLREVEPRA